MIRRHIEKLGFKLSDIKILLTSQVHYDHVAAMAEIKKLTGAKVMVNEKDAQVLADGGNSDYLYGGNGSLFNPVKPDRLLHNHDTIKLDGTQVIALHHPGHTKGSTSFLLNVKDEGHRYTVLIANMPSIIVEGQLKSLPSYPEIVEDYAYTLNAMKQLHFDLWVAAHASQCDLQKKHAAGTQYNPGAFRDQKGYDDAIARYEAAYNKKLNEK
jgi:metallo-beta-lactamase class B